MRFVVHALDKADGLTRRLSAIDAHRAYLDRAPAKHGLSILLSGPLVDDSGQAMVGSFFLLEAPSRAAVEALFAEDPLNLAEVWETRTITAVVLRQSNMA